MDIAVTILIVAAAAVAVVAKVRQARKERLRKQVGRRLAEVTRLPERPKQYAALRRAA